MFTTLFYALSFKDVKCFWDPHFGYFVTIELFHCVLLNHYIAPYSSHYVICVKFV